MALEVLSTNFAFGYYTATFDPAGSGIGATDLGLVEGPRLLDLEGNWTPIMSDAFGDSVIEGICRGGNVYLSMTFKTWTAVVLSALWPFSTANTDSSAGVDLGEVGLAGRAITSIAGQLVLTPVSGTPAASVAGGTITFHRVVPIPNQRTQIPYGNVARDVAVAFQCIGVANGSSPETVRFFTVSGGT